MASGANYVQTQSITIPSNLSAGQYDVYVFTDAFDQVNQPGAEANKIGQSLNPIQISLSPVPDLTAVNVAGPSAGGVGQNVTITWTDENIGQASATGPWVDYLYLSPDGKLGDATFLGYYNFTGSIAAGSQRALSDSVALPTLADGAYYLIVDTNAQNQVFVRGATNNVGVSAATIQLGHPDLVINSVTAPTAAQSGTAAAGPTMST